MSASRVAVVSGANQGIGFAIVEQLCKKFDGEVFLTARNVTFGEEAVKKLNEKGLHPKFHQLDIEDDKSIQNLHDFIKLNYGGIDILVNNAAMAFKNADQTPFPVQAETTIKINFTQLLKVCDTLFPLLRPHARVVNLSSSLGQLSFLKSDDLKKKFKSESLTIPELCSLMEKFVSDAQTGVHVENGYSDSAYSMSKIGVTALTRIQQRQFNSDSREGIIVTAVHPGYVSTNMTSYKGPATIEEGSVAPVHCALLPKYTDEYKGAYVYQDTQITEWQ